jgi:hypothetical protein
MHPPRTFPPRPDLPSPVAAGRPRRPLRWIALIAAVAIGAGTVAGGAAPVLPGAGGSGSDPGSFRFLQRVDGTPRRWDPCRPISYRINLLDAPPSAAADLGEAFERAGVATGIRFDDAGAATLPALEQATDTIELGVTVGADIWVVWLPHESFAELLDRIGMQRDAVAIGVPFPGSGSDEGSWVGGLIAVDASVRMPPGFGSAYAHGVVLMHEIGHVLGLGHVGDPAQVMYSGRSPDPTVRDWGRGDLEGLRRLGADAGCL